MAKPSQSSFRRILLSRILLLSVPVLLIGEAVVFGKARSSLLETTQRNLTESAVRKGESISNEIAALKANLLVASQTTFLQKGTEEQAQQFLDQLATQLPTHVQCVRLTNLQSGNVISSTCGDVAKTEFTTFYSGVSLATTAQSHQQQGWKTKPGIGPMLADGNHIDVKVLQSASPSALESRLPSLQGKLQLLLSTPVYNSAGQLRYALSIQSVLDQQRQLGARSGTVIIAENGTILAHSFNRLGRNLDRKVDIEEIQNIVKNATAQKQEPRYLSFDPVEWLVGYTTIPSPITNNPDQHWIVLAVTDLDNALFDLQGIKIILFLLTFGVLGASFLATLYLAHDLARSLQKLRDYALNSQSCQTAKCHNFKIRELSQLKDALDFREKHLKAWTEEIESAWKEAIAANELKSEFLATTSHELRTPLNSIIGCVRIVRDGCCDDREEEMEFLERADQAAIHLLGIIDDLLDIAKIEAGKLSVVLEPIDLQQVLKEVINLQTVHIQQKCLQLINPDWQEPIVVQADTAKLKQVLINVIGNAVKFTEQGSITIKTRIEYAADVHDSATRVFLTVEDTGVGIDPAQQDKLFRPFVTVDDTTTRKFGGNGLGLAISRNLIELMGGSITVCSAGSGQGTTVEIALQLIGTGELLSRGARERELVTTEY